MIKKTLKKLERFFDLRVGWFFVNGRKKEEWYKYLKNKYDNSI